MINNSLKQVGVKDNLKKFEHENAIPSDSDNESDNPTSYYDRLSKDPFVVFARKLMDKNIGKAISILKVLRRLIKVNVKYNLIKSPLWNTWKLYFESYHDANMSLNNKYLKELSLTTFILRFIIYRKGVIKNIPLDISLEEIQKTVIEENPFLRINNVLP